MPEAVLTLLKFCLVAVLYLFFFRVLRAVWAEIKQPEVAPAPPPAARVAAATAAPRQARPAPAPGPSAAPGPSGPPGSLQVVKPPALAGRSFHDRAPWVVSLQPSISS